MRRFHGYKNFFEGLNFAYYLCFCMLFINCDDNNYDECHANDHRGE